MEKAKSIEHLNHAPIIEAVLDFKVTPNPDATRESLDLHEFTKKNFPERHIAHSLQYTGTFALEMPESAEHKLQDEILGFRFIGDGKLFQSRFDGFTFNKLPPYTTWEETLSQAWKLWQLYVEHAKPVEITRIGVRYINKSTFPNRNVKTFIERPCEFNEFVPGIPLNNYLFQSKLKISEEINAVVTQIVEPDSSSAGLSYILDIDVSRNGSFLVNEPNLKDFFVELQDFKNKIFFNTVTEATLDIWK